MNFNQISTGEPEDMPKSTTTWAKSNYYDNDYFAPKGWVCPKCGRVYSPNTSICFYCNDNNRVTPITNVTPITVRDKTFPNDWFVYHVVDPLKEPEIHLDEDWKNKAFFVNYDKFPYYNI